MRVRKPVQAEGRHRGTAPRSGRTPFTTFTMICRILFSPEGQNHAVLQFLKVLFVSLKKHVVTWSESAIMLFLVMTHRTSVYRYAIIASLSSPSSSEREVRGLLFPTEALRAPRLANSIWMWDQPSQWFRTNRWRLYSYFTSYCSRNTLCRWRRKTGRDGNQATYHFLIISGSTEAVPVPTQLPHLGTGLQKVNCYLIRLGKKHRACQSGPVHLPPLEFTE